MGTEWKKRELSSSGTNGDGLIQETPDDSGFAAPGIRYPRKSTRGTVPGYIDPDMVGDDVTAIIDALDMVELGELRLNEDDMGVLRRLGEMASEHAEGCPRVWDGRERVRQRYANNKGNYGYVVQEWPGDWMRPSEEPEEYDVASELRKAMGRM